MLKLTPRMQMAADMVRPGHVLCDIGTDHAYLPSYLILNGIIPSALACDIGRGPLDNALKSVQAYDISDRVTLRLSDGFDSINPDEADDFALCGMGGTLMAELLGRTVWLKNPEKRIIAQPMSHIEDVRKFFIENGFDIIGENVCREADHVYACICAQWSGKATHNRPGFIYYGLLPESSNPDSRAHIQKQLDKLITRKNGIKDNPQFADEYGRLLTIIDDITEVLDG